MKKLATLLFSFLLVFSFSFNLASAQSTQSDEVEESEECLTVTRNIRQGSKDTTTDQSVSTLQEFLTEQGLYTAPINGRFGPSTKRALISFQKNNNLIGTGIAGAATRAKINTIMCSNSPSNETVTVTPTPNPITPIQNAFTCPGGYTCAPTGTTVTPVPMVGCTQSGTGCIKKDHYTNLNDEIIKAVAKVFYFNDNDDRPNILTITSDAIKQLKQTQPFFVDVEVGQHVLIFSKTKRVLIWDHNLKRIMKSGPIPEVDTNPSVCTQEAKQCSDGSYVSRDASNKCEFKKCPEVVTNKDVSKPLYVEIISPTNNSDLYLGKNTFKARVINGDPNRKYIYYWRDGYYGGSMKAESDIFEYVFNYPGKYDMRAEVYEDDIYGRHSGSHHVLVNVLDKINPNVTFELPKLDILGYNPQKIDVVGAWGNFNPGVGNINKNSNDFYFYLNINPVNYPVTIKSMTLKHNNSSEYWSTSDKNAYPIKILGEDRYAIRKYENSKYEDNLNYRIYSTGGEANNTGSFFRIAVQPEHPEFMGGKLIV